MALLVLMAICWTSRHVSSGLDNRQLLLLRCGGLGTYRTPSASAKTPAALGAAADVPPCPDEHLLWISVVTYHRGEYVEQGLYDD